MFAICAQNHGEVFKVSIVGKCMGNLGVHIGYEFLEVYGHLRGVKEVIYMSYGKFMGTPGSIGDFYMSF